MFTFYSFYLNLDFHIFYSMHSEVIPAHSRVVRARLKWANCSAAELRGRVGNQEFGSGHVKSQMPLKYPRGDAERTELGTSDVGLGNHIWHL